MFLPSLKGWLHRGAESGHFRTRTIITSFKFKENYSTILVNSTWFLLCFQTSCMSWIGIRVKSGVSIWIELPSRLISNQHQPPPTLNNVIVRKGSLQDMDYRPPRSVYLSRRDEAVIDIWLRCDCKAFLGLDWFCFSSRVSFRVPPDSMQLHHRYFRISISQKGQTNNLKRRHGVGVEWSLAAGSLDVLCVSKAPNGFSNAFLTFISHS